MEEDQAEGRHLYTTPTYGEDFRERRMCLYLSKGYGYPQILPKRTGHSLGGNQRFVNPHEVYVDLSKKLYDTKMLLLDQMGEK